MDADLPVVLFAVILGAVFLSDCILGCIAYYEHCQALRDGVLWDAYPERKRH